MKWHFIIGDAFLLDPETISRIEAITVLDLSDSTENLTILLDLASKIWEVELMDVSVNFYSDISSETSFHNRWSYLPSVLIMLRLLKQKI